MEFDYHLLFNFASIFVTILLMLTTCTTVFQRLKLRWPLKVNCWFCNKNSKVWRQEIDWWLCPFCEQYNGFLKSGDYAYRIPEQYKNSLNNNKRYCTFGQSTETNEMSSNNNLCEQCNANESLKLLELSKFEPVCERYYEYELQKFKDGLEEKYPLCDNCKNTVYDVLHRQAQWFAQYKMLLFKQKPLAAIVNNPSYSGSVFRIISTILGSMIVYDSEFVLLPIGGLFFQSCACWMTPAKRRSSDALLAFLWICIIVLVPFKDLKLFKTDIQNTWVPLEYVTQYHVIMVLAVVIGWFNVMPKSYKSTHSKNMSFKKIESPSRSTVLSNSHTPTNTNDNHNCVRRINNFSTGRSNIQPLRANNQAAVHSVNSFRPISVDNTASRKPTILQTPIIKDEPTTSSIPVSNNAYRSSVTPFENFVDNYSLDDSLSALCTLSLGEDMPMHSTRTPTVFERKVYCTKSPDMFKKLNVSTNKRNILSPPKLKSVTQASWVAGGYWQEGIDAPSLSRSSSQSSGFGSTGSNFAPSREPSVREFDQYSVVSDATQSCHVPRQSSTSPVGSCVQKGSQFTFAEPKNPIFNQTTKHAFSPQPLLQCQDYQRSNRGFTDQCVQRQRKNVTDIKSSCEMQMIPSHTTILTSPVWLPALLCSSLVLNIIALCTTLLR